MKQIVISALLLSACADHQIAPVQSNFESSRELFQSAIPSDWTPQNFPVRVIEHYKSKGATGVVAMDMNNIITTFEICNPTDLKCYDTAVIEAKANCENQVHLGLLFDIFSDKTPECRIVIIDDKFVHSGKLTINDVNYLYGDLI